jgi:malic enzyme
VCPERRSVPELRGYDLLQHPRYNRGMAFTEEERDALGLRGLLPPRIISLTDQVERSMRHLERKITPLERYIYMTGLLDRGEVLFYRTVIDHIVELMPIIYTPTVGEACQRWGEIFRRQRGLYVTSDDRGRVRDVLRNWPDTDVEVVVATDGERILGLGDLGAQGMGIPIGKLALYTACAGIAPARCLPITIDVGTENLELRQSPFYPGLDQPRLRGAEYDALMEEFVDAVREVFPRAMLQWEDFATDNAFRVLAAHRHRIRSFNDDIQGTASVALAGLYAASRATDRPLHTQRVLFFGAGSAATGIGELVVSAMVADGIPEAEARRRCWFVDSKGLVTSNRTDLAPHKLPFAHDHPPLNDLHSAMRSIKPTALIGVAAQRADPAHLRRPGTSAHRVCPVESHIKGGVHRRRGIPLDRWTGPVRERLSDGARGARRQHVLTSPGQQRVHLPRCGPRCRRHPGANGQRCHVPGRCTYLGRDGHRCRPRGGCAVSAAHRDSARVGAHCDRGGAGGSRRGTRDGVTTGRSRRVAGRANVRSDLSGG